MRPGIIPATIFGFLGAVALLGSLFMIGVMAWYNVQLGPITPSPETEALNQIALTATNIARLGACLAAGVFGLVAAWAWLKKWRAPAIVLSVAYFALSGIFVALSQSVAP